MSRAAVTVRRFLPLVVAALGLMAAAAEEPGPALEFLRVRVPRGRLEDVPLGAGRYVPMAAEEFERAVARMGPRPAADPAPQPLVERARYQLTGAESGQLVGRLSIDVSPAAAAALPELDLGGLRPARCSLRTATGRGEVVLFGRDDGTVALRVREAGTYECDARIDPDAPGSREYTLRLPPTLATSIRLRPPPGWRPLPAVEPGGTALVHSAADGAWMIDAGPVRQIRLSLVPAEPEPPLLTAWTDTRVRGTQMQLVTAVVPRTTWPTGALRLEKSAGLRVVAVRSGADGPPIAWDAEPDGQAVEIRLPAAVVGRSEPVTVEAVASLDVPLDAALPWVRVAAAAWAGGGSRVEIDPALGVVGVTPDACRPVTPETAARWPLPARAPRVEAEAAVQPSVMHFEHQSATATLALSLQRRRPQLDVARVTTIDLSRGRVLGRAACDLRVLTGETYTVTAAVLPGWLIDSVQLVEPFDSATEPDARHADESQPVAWQATSSRDGPAELRIDLPLAATPRRGVGLRVNGHRSGVPLGGKFRVADMDMVRFEGETGDGTAVDFNVGPEAVVEIGGAPLGVMPISARLARLVEPGAARARLQGGQRAADRTGRVLQRRPPLDARVDVRLVARDERLGQAFRFTCRPEAAAVDSLVVHFSEPMGDELQWSLLEPRGGSLAARRLDAGDDARGPAARLPGCAESWLVEIRPAFIGSVTVQASRDVAFREPQPMPLAWVEGATDARGTVTVEDAGRGRLTVRNRRLRELPPAPADGRPPALAEFAYSMPQAGAEAEVAAEVAPATGAEARAWAWSESLACWCHDSGQWECEADYDIENHGRDAMAINVPPGRRVTAVLLDGSTVPVESLDAGGTIRLPLSPDRRRLRVVVRTVAQARSGTGLWTVDPICCAIDVPVLEQRLAVLLPPELEAVTLGSGYRDAEPTAPGLATRLLAARTGGPAATASPATGESAGPAARMAGGFSEHRFVPVPGRRAAGIVVVRRRLVATCAILCGFLACLAALRLCRRGIAGGVLLAAAAAVLAVWLEPPLGTIARAAWWGGLAGCVVRAIRHGRLGTAAATWLVAIGACGLPAAAAEPAPIDPDPLRVFLTPGDGGDVALVPEPLFRALVQEAPPAAVATVRIRRLAVLVEDGQPAAAWRLLLDIDADAGGAIVLDQRSGDSRWLPPAGGDEAVQVTEDGQALRLAPPVGGRRRVELRVAPTIERRGRLEMATIDLPPAAEARLELVDAQGAAVVAAADAVQCDRGLPRGPFVRAAAASDGRAGFDVSGAARVRLVRPIDGRDSLASGIAATSENEIAWRLDSCRVRGRFDVAGEAIVRAVVVAADPRLQPVEQQAADGQIVTPLGDGRHLIERVAAEPGPARFRLELEMPLAEAVGVFDAPGAWLEAAEADSRTVRVIASSDLQATLETRGAAAVGRGVEGGDRNDTLRYEAGRAVAATPTVRLSAVRRPQEIRGSQTLAAGIAADGIGLRLRCRIDASSTPLVEVPVEIPPGCDIERVMLREDDFTAPEGGPRSLVDLQWSMTAANRLSIFVQQPRAGRYRLEVDGRLASRPESRGRIPLLRAELGGGSPLVVLWRQDGLPASTPVTVEVPPGEPGPFYELAAAPPAIEPAAPPAIDPGERPADRVERALVSATVDDRGRLRGLACYDVVASRSVLRLRLPAGTRLFDVLVDGRDTVARPVAEDAWELQLQAASWPRTLLIVFAGELEPATAAGRPVRLLHPRIDGLPCQEVLWTIDPPAGRGLRVAEPARVLDAAAWEDACRLARGRIDAAFARARAGADDLDAERLGALAADRFGGRAAALEASGESAVEAAFAEPPVRVAAPGDDGITVRVVRKLDASLPARAAATVGLATIAALAWFASRRGTAWWPRLPTDGDRGGPWLLAATGAGWAAVLVPALPGWLLLAAGVAWLVMRRRSRLAARAADPGRPPAEDSLTQSLPGR